MIIGDILSIISEIKNDDSFDTIEGIPARAAELLIGGKRGKNLKSRSRNNICQFPVLMSDAISKDTMYLLNTALEKEYMSDIRLLIDNENLYNVKAKNGTIDKQAFIRQFHSNDRFNNFSNDEVGGVVAGTLSLLADDMKIANKELLTPYDENYNFSYVGYNEAEGDKSDDIKDQEHNAKMTEYSDKHRAADDAHRKSELEITGARIQNAVKAKQLTMLNKPDATLSGVSFEEVRKVNELQPLILKTSITYVVSNGQSSVPVTTDIYIGIKTIIHPIKSSEMIYYIPRMLREGRFLFNFIRFTTGEIAFFKDLVLQFDANKNDAIMSNKKSSVRWFKHLKDRSKWAKFKSLFSKNQLIPNATLVITREEADMLKNKYRIDLLGSAKREARKLMDILFLMNFIIVDEADKIVYAYDDTNGEWEYHSFKELRSAGDKSDDSLELILTALGKSKR